MPFFSVIIPNYNHGNYLEDRILSILNQTYTNFELIILDDNSTDNSKTILQQYENHPLVSQIIYNDINSCSPFLQWKKGIELATANWIWIAESDDIADPLFLAEAAAAIQNLPAIGCYYTDSFIIDKNTKITGKASDIKNNFFETKKWTFSYQANGIQELNESLKFLCTINNTSAMVFKKEIFIAVQEEVTCYRYYGDWVFYMLAMLRTDIYYNHSVLSSYRNHPGNFISKNAPAIKTKKEYYGLLIFLLSKSEITERKKVIRFFCLHYLGSGWIEEGLGNAVLMLWIYFKMDKRLALKVIPRVIWYKIARRKNKKQYP